MGYPQHTLTCQICACYRCDTHSSRCTELPPEKVVTKKGSGSPLITSLPNGLPNRTLCFRGLCLHDRYHRRLHAGYLLSGYNPLALCACRTKHVARLAYSRPANSSSDSASGWLIIAACPAGMLNMSLQWKPICCARAPASANHGDSVHWINVCDRESL